MTAGRYRADVGSISTLDDPVRRRLYDVICQRAAPVGRDEAAAAAGISRPLAVYHLDRLVKAGLLAASYRRPAGRAGPGAGRPAKLYAPSGREFAVTVPPREYELAATILARAVEADRSGASVAALRDAAHQLGAELAAGREPAAPGQSAPRQPESLLSQHGYEPVSGEDGSIWLRNCPFRQLAEQHRDVVCRMNLALISGFVTGLRLPAAHPVLSPQRGHCCVVITRGRAAPEHPGGLAGRAARRPAGDRAAAPRPDPSHCQPGGRSAAR